MGNRTEYFRRRHEDKKIDPIYIERRRLNSLLWIKNNRPSNAAEKLEKKLKKLEPFIGYHLIEFENLGI